MLSLPQEAGVVQKFKPAFTKPTFERFVTLLIGGIISMGRRTVSHILWSVRGLIRGHYSSYHRVFSSARWSLWPLARVLATAVVALVPRKQPLIVDVDDTVAGHRGRRVYGKACHRDAVNSSRGHTVFKWGHKWVVMAINVKLPLCKRPWALPVLLALHQPQPRKRKNKRAAGKSAKPIPWSKIKARRRSRKHQVRHKKPAQLARQMIAALLHWFPDRRFILLGDWGFASHDLALFCHRHRDRLTLIARTRSDIRLFSLPPKAASSRRGRRVRKGRRLPSPSRTVEKATNRRHARVRWYGNSQRDLELLGGCGGWYRGRGEGRAGLVPVRWVHVHDPRSGREDYFYSTNPKLEPEQIVELFAARWNVEVTFEEAKGLLGFESTRQRCKNSVLRTGPCLMGLFTIVSLIFAELAKRGDIKLHGTPCYVKTAPTFADALAAVRRLFWEEVIMLQAPGAAIVTKLPKPLREMLVEQLTAAA